MDIFAFSPSLFSTFTFPFLFAWTLRVIGAVLVLSLGSWVANRATAFLRSLMKQATEKESIAASPLGMMSQSLSAMQGSGLASNALYWGIFFFFFLLAGELLGLPFFHETWRGLLLWLPSVVSALLVLVFGIVLAGVLEQAVKQPLKRMAPQQAVLAGTFTSYGVVALFTMVAISELGIASQFILVLFGGVVFALALAFGLAFGLGAQEMVHDMLMKMVQEETRSRGKKK